MEILLILTFVIGYALIAMEHSIKIDKAVPALLTGVLCWVVYIFSQNDVHVVNEQLSEHLGEISGILFFLIGAMTIVELIDLHDGFRVITEKIKTKDKKKLMIIFAIIAFFLSAVLDNLTTAIVMGSMLSKVLEDKTDRLYFASLIIIAANAGGAWSPIGDVTTTMLWLGNQISTFGIVSKVFLPSVVCLAIPLFLMLRLVKGETKVVETNNLNYISIRDRNIIFYVGLGAMLFVPIFKTITHLPPFMGMMFSVGLLWIISEYLHFNKVKEEKAPFSIFRALEKMDMPSILFFFGILLAVSALQSFGTLNHLATTMTQHIPNENLIVTIIGIMSSIFDNVPLVAAVQGMYSIEMYPTDHFFWEYLAYCAGTGGSILVIGSAAGVAMMGIEKISFFWYVKKISIYALAGFLGGAIVSILLSNYFHA
jgi:Na+/H+ antiporter NhaD/arsenite permease-like protein